MQTGRCCKHLRGQRIWWWDTVPEGISKKDTIKFGNRLCLKPHLCLLKFFLRQHKYQAHSCPYLLLPRMTRKSDGNRLCHFIVAAVYYLWHFLCCPRPKSWVKQWRKVLPCWASTMELLGQGVGIIPATPTCAVWLGQQGTWREITSPLVLYHQG